jgi:membrane-associated phospholipid phosphatase
MTEPSPGRAIAGPTLLRSGLAFLLGFLVLTTAVTLHGLDGVDQQVRSVVHQSQGPRLQIWMEGASAIGGQPGQLTIVIIGSTILWWRRRPGWALALPLAMTGVGIVQFAAKWAMDRPRPNLHPWGFPSAHVLSLVVLGGLLAYMVGQTRRGRRWQPLAVGIVGSGVLVVAYSRIYLEAHWLSDVLGGMTAGLAYMLMVIWLMAAAPRLVQSWGSLPRTAPVQSVPVPVVAAASAEPQVVSAATTITAPATFAVP